MARLHNADIARCALDKGQASLVYRSVISDTETPVSAAIKLMQPQRGDFLLESVEGGETRARHSIIGLDPDMVFVANADAAKINQHWQFEKESFQDCPQPPLDALKALSEKCHMDVPQQLPRALAFLVGYFGFETLGQVEDIPRAAPSVLDVPDMVFVRPSVVLVFDQLKDEMFLVVPVWPRTGADTDKIISAAHDRIDAIERQLAAGLPKTHIAEDIGAPPTPEPVLESGQYKQMVLKAKDYIQAGDIFQVVLAQRFTAPYALPPFSLYRALRRINPSPFLYFLDLPYGAIIGSSPEILVRVRDDEVTIRPIAGTRPRGKTAQEDNDNEKSLLADPKERAEHLMLLDLGRNDVGRVAQAGTVCVTDSFAIERYSHVMHIVSNVIGQIDGNYDAMDAIFAGFPAGTVSGAPKIRACEIIAELEPESRGAYAGSVGYFAADGSVDSCIVLRTAIVKDGIMHVQAGAGIVADSDPDYEQKECEAKAGALFAAAGEAYRLADEAEFGQ